MKVLYSTGLSISARVSASGSSSAGLFRQACMMADEPTFEVRMMMVLRKSMGRPSASSISPLSNTWKNISSTSGWAFSTSSSSTTLYGLRRTASVNTPPSP